MTQGYTTYAQTEFQTSSPMKLVLMLYDGAITFLNQAASCAAEGDIKHKNQYAGQARDIITELNNNLDMQAGGEIAKNLRRLYFFMNRHLMEANWKNDVEGFRRVIDLLSNLREAWQSVYDQRGETSAPARRMAFGVAA